MRGIVHGEAALRIQGHGRRRLAVQEVEKRRAESKRLQEELLAKEVRRVEFDVTSATPNLPCVLLGILTGHITPSSVAHATHATHATRPPVCTLYTPSPLRPPYPRPLSVLDPPPLISALYAPHPPLSLCAPHHASPSRYARLKPRQLQPKRRRRRRPRRVIFVWPHFSLAVRCARRWRCSAPTGR